ncbi:hypothetical protein PC128_g8153 [Phytophthora cactorum]|nr:hypothetical protein PC128_g8153 [Phytophthora cactorum]
MDLAVKLEDFDSSEQFTVLEMDKYDLILGMPWLEKHEPWIDWRGKAIGASRPAVSDRALVSHVSTSVRNWSARKGRQDAVASKEYLGVVDVLDDSTEVVAAGAAPDRARQPCSGSLDPHRSQDQWMKLRRWQRQAAPARWVTKVHKRSPRP